MNDAFGRIFRIFVLLALGALAMVVAPDIVELVGAPGAPSMWWASRTMGLLAYVSLWLSVLFGLFMSSRGAGGWLHQATVLDLHNRWAVAALITTTLHVLATVGDAEYGITALALVYPLASKTQAGAVALGSLALWGMIAIGVTTAIFQKIPRSLWRAVHATAFGTWLLALIHGLAAGTDTSAPVVRGVYLATTVVTVAAVIQRLLIAQTQQRAKTTANP